MSSSPSFNEILGADVSHMRYVEILSDDKLFQLLNTYIAENSPDAKSFSATSVSLRRNTNSTNDSDDEEKSSDKRVDIKLGFGEFRFRDSNGTALFAVYKSEGIPVGTNCCAERFSHLFIFTEGSLDGLKDFFTQLVNQSEKSHPGVIDIYSWNIRRQYWASRSNIRARKLDSVILPEKTKSQIVGDVENFLSKKSKAFYTNHGIPYRRSYLLHGVPGAGKTSLIQAVAGHFNRSISFLQPTHPEMTDDSLAAAMSELPRNTVVVLEDIDALFGKDRSSKVAKSSLTFSGLLNALDGIGSTCGQLIFMTTNLRDQLDPALIRNGRVDFHIHFDYACDEQIQEMWNSYYPDATHLAEHFCSSLRLKLEGKPIATAGLQHYFVINMMNSAEEAIARVDAIIEDMKQKAVEAVEQNDADGIGAEIRSTAGSDVTATTSDSGPTSVKVFGQTDLSKKTGSVNTCRDVHIYLHAPGIDTKAVSIEITDPEV